MYRLLILTLFVAVFLFCFQSSQAAPVKSNLPLPTVAVPPIDVPKNSEGFKAPLWAILETYSFFNDKNRPAEIQERFFEDMQRAVHEVAVALEVLDPRETRYILSRYTDFSSDMTLLRNRLRDLEDAPLVSDSFRFPERAAVNELVRFNRAYRKHLDQRAELEKDREEILQQVMKETDYLYQIWDAVRDARCEFYYVTVRRQALQKLRNLVGEERYLRAELPPNVPTWRFQEMR